MQCLIIAWSRFKYFGCMRNMYGYINLDTAIIFRQTFKIILRIIMI